MQSSTGQMVRQKVAAYARVSTEHEEQQSSYEAQVDYYTRKITGRSDWGIVEVYTDRRVSRRCLASFLERWYTEPEMV